MESDGAVQVDSTRWLTFQPRGSNPKTGFIVYPGGLVDPRAYAPESRAIAARGYLVVIVPMPLNFAIIAPDRAADVIAAYPAVQAWAIGGHSLGGVAAARFIHYHPGAVRGLVLWASYPDVSA